MCTDTNTHNSPLTHTHTTNHTMCTLNSNGNTLGFFNKITEV